MVNALPVASLARKKAVAPTANSEIAAVLCCDSLHNMGLREHAFEGLRDQIHATDTEIFRLLLK
jgi:hypothetical protein